MANDLTRTQQILFVTICLFILFALLIYVVWRGEILFTNPCKQCEKLGYWCSPKFSQPRIYKYDAEKNATDWQILTKKVG